LAEGLLLLYDLPVLEGWRRRAREEVGFWLGGVWCDGTTGNNGDV
jgi:hypothetical protein